ncbi:hypothetical protein LTR35_014019 [Friedmanniomyces endolithicus]|nr:hypothetical protein LTR35_014019 [Friedmanniomyces endolithicus]KAK0281104.1 hypothetical protein LTS00_012745 [Friedmanniomyces endolithicus]KAK0987205.1 hypothetical protein LTR54_013158 [Friedmanniomyces endolithicus]
MAGLFSRLRDLLGRPLWTFNPDELAADFRENPNNYIEQAASGFLTDSYNLFASNVILPCLTFVYWNECGHTKETWINIATLLGSAVGQLLFGYLADRYGRKSLYGVELWIVIFSTLLIAQTSAGYGAPNSGETSMSLYGMLLAWRFFMGVGIGAEYPLSACITAEWASTRERGRMMCAVFLMQPMGQLLAWSVGLIALEILSHSHDFSTDSPDAKVGIDKLWRWVIGMGAIPAALAILFRITIPESGRYTYDVKKDGPRALHDKIGVFQPASGRSSHHRLPQFGVELQGYPQQRTSVDGDAQSVAPDGIPRSVHPSANGEWQQVDLDSANGDEVVQPQPSLNEPADHLETLYHKRQRSTKLTAHPNIPYRSHHTPTTLQVLEFPDALSDDSSADLNQLQDRRMSMVKNQFEQPLLREYFWEKGNWRYLAGTSITWFLLDFAFFGLGFNSPTTMAKLWTSGPMPACGDVPAYLFISIVGAGGNIYQVLYSNARQSLLKTSIASCVGSIALILAINHIDRRVTLIWTFVALAILLLITGIVFLQVFHTSGYAATIVLYAFSQLVFSFGPNTLTFILPAEIFPTRYRCTCHGIAAASGKLGAVMVQFVFLGYQDRELQQPNSRALGKVIIIFAAFMLLGAVFAWAWIPAVQTKSEDPRDLLQNIDLETLALGEERLPKEQKIGFRNRTRGFMSKGVRQTVRWRGRERGGAEDRRSM